MSAGSSNDSGDGQDFELNLAPIIDCFTVLITYMLVSASFISLDMLEVQIAASSPPVEGEPPPPMDEIPTAVSARVNQDGSILLEVTGRKPASFVAAPGELSEKVQDVLSAYPRLQEINVKAEPGVHYRAIVKSVDELKKSFPKVFLGE